MGFPGRDIPTTGDWSEADLREILEAAAKKERNAGLLALVPGRA